MTPEQQAEKIKEIYDEAIRKLDEIGHERQEIIKAYIAKLESQKIDAIRASLGLPINND
ncbi:MAG: hypothetical protein JWM20_709 [Patescibacteria group bacterium]|nr:hypothetical protein [Patescibacteria group bacterium]